MTDQDGPVRRREDLIEAGGSSMNAQISYRRAALWSLVLLLGVPIALQPARPWIAAHWPLPDPTVWQAVVGLVGQFVIIALAVTVWNQRQRLREAERERARWKLRAQSDE